MAVSSTFLQPTEFDSLKNVTEGKIELFSIQLDLHLASILFTKQGQDLSIWEFNTVPSLHSVYILLALLESTYSMNKGMQKIWGNVQAIL